MKEQYSGATSKDANEAHIRQCVGTAAVAVVPRESSREEKLPTKASNVLQLERFLDRKRIQRL